jgi:hypothetical protein
MRPRRDDMVRSRQELNHSFFEQLRDFDCVVCADALVESVPCFTNNDKFPLVVEYVSVVLFDIEILPVYGIEQVDEVLYAGLLERILVIRKIIFVFLFPVLSQMLRTYYSAKVLCIVSGLKIVASPAALRKSLLNAM